jgi:acetyltransferase-like isoleucine patch superfamily enzyme
MAHSVNDGKPSSSGTGRSQWSVIDRLQSSGHLRLASSIQKLISYVEEHRSSPLSRLLAAGYYLGEGTVLFWATFTGYIPSHFVRRSLYSWLFRVKVPRDSIIYWRCRFFGPWNVHIGHNSIIGNDAFLDGRGRLHIGNNVNIGAEVRIYTREHDVTSPTHEGRAEPVHIEDYVYIGARVTVLPGTTIGEGAVVSAGAVVTKNVEPWTIVGGVPARFIKKRPVVKYTLDTKHKTLFQ